MCEHEHGFKCARVCASVSVCEQSQQVCDSDIADCCRGGHVAWGLAGGWCWHAS